MSGITFGGGSSLPPSQPIAPNNTYEALGMGTDGEGTTMTAGTAPSPGASWTTIGTTGATAWAGFILSIGNSSGASIMYMIDIRIAGTTTILPTFLTGPGSTTIGGIKHRFNIAIPAGTLVEARIRAGSSSATLSIGLLGILANEGIPDGFSTATAISVNTTNVRGGTTTIPLTDTWTDQVTLAADFDALVIVLAWNGTAVATNQNVLVSLGTSPAGSSEVLFLKDRFTLGTASPSVLRQFFLPIEAAFASGTHLHMKAKATTPGSDALTAAIYGLS